ncbi:MULTISPECIES: phage major capsid protein [Bacillus cereus group]|uniref:Cps n=1 Tax=Bacillus cereus (strain AH187) TaxID=405534 RepID=B7HV39_BACC7|nr:MULTISPECIES: phage major capsid protein [Bacillus cereus group]ACJ80222.1 Cps [Bacillus cereus AH187]ADA84949.1 Cps [Bacillus phage 11143]MBR9742058.1 phage major capsid protein [Bacillus paranthracis]MDX5778705.1 phage major capsid protein [Bacillus cereus group sp. DSM 4312]QGG21253.1 phage major capsid protein [Bacillus paranthracis]
MVIKFNNFEEKKLAFAKATQEGTPEEQTAALNSMIEALATDVRVDILNQVNESMVDRSIMQSRGSNVLTSEEMKFFNAVVQDGGFKDTEILPKTTQERIFDDLVSGHPFLEHIGLENLGAVTELIYGDPEGAAVWGPLFGDIQGQLNATFRKEPITQLKLTAFIPLSNDMLNLGPVWVERYVRTMITEAMAVGLERGFVVGTGKNEPIGLLKDPSGNVVGGVYPDKKSAGTLTFEPGRKTINELKGVVKLLAKKLKADGKDADKPKNIAGKVVMVTNPFDTFDVQANATTLNAAGVYVTSLPFNPTPTESVFVPQGKVLFFVKGEYIAAMGGTEPIKKFDQTLALEDATLYIAKQYATGKPKDKYAAQVYELKIEEVTPPTQG